MGNKKSFFGLKLVGIVLLVLALNFYILLTSISVDIKKVSDQISLGIGVSKVVEIVEKEAAFPNMRSFWCDWKWKMDEHSFNRHSLGECDFYQQDYFDNPYREPLYLTVSFSISRRYHDELYVSFDRDGKVIEVSFRENVK